MRSIKLMLLLPLVLTLGAVPLLAAQGQGGPVVRESHLIQVILLLGRTEGAPGTPDLPKNAVQTLKDVESFLPYKSYQLLDTSLIRSDGQARSVLHGPSGREFSLTLSFITMREDAGQRLTFNRFSIEAPPEPPTPPEPPAPSEPPAPPESPPPSAERPAAAPRVLGPVLSSSFAVDVGETIVVGTSKLNGGKEALLVLLTVIP